MPEDKKDDKRRRMVVEEVGEVNPEVIPSEPLEEIKEKAQEIETLADVAAAPVEMPTPPVTPLTPTSFEPKSNKGVNPLVVIIPGIFLLGGLLGGIIFYQNRVSGTTPQSTDSPTIAPGSADIPTPTPTAAAVDLTKYNISIQNGSGTAGEAGKVQTLLEAAGFEVSGTGNAANYDYTKTVIQAKSDVEKGFIAKLSEALGETYSVDSKVATLSASSKEAVIVIVGSTKK